MRGRVIVAAGAALSLAIFPAASAFAAKKNTEEMRQFQQEIARNQRITQALNRLEFGPRPGDAEAVAKIGLKKWIEQQLHPESIPQNRVLADKLKSFDTLAMPSDALVRNYPSPQIVKQMESGQMPYPSDPDRRLVVERLIARAEAKQAQGNIPPPGPPQPGVPQTDPALELRGKLTPQQIRSVRAGTPAERIAAFNSLSADQQTDVIAALPGVRQTLVQNGSPEQRRRAQLFNAPQQAIYRDLAEAKILRAVYSNRQLEEVLDDFWFNHFNVFLDKGADRYLVTEYERDVIRPRVLGKFRDLLEATAKSPAMLFYLDNWQSAGPNAPQRGPNQARRGLNENYGRELLELHTLGVDGGYTQKDVTEVARCFTGWTINQPQRGGSFVFNPRLHDNGEKVVLGIVIPAGGGEKDGEKVLDIVARHPSTAHFISQKLAMRFVADDPPEALVARMAQTFLKTDGDIRAVLETMINSREFYSAGAYQTKMKSPLEMVASAIRAVNGDVDYATALIQQVANLGEPLYRKQEPTGYSNSSREWVSTAGLMARMNFALQLTGNKVPGVKVETAAATPSGTTLGSPAFQKH